MNKTLQTTEFLKKHKISVARLRDKNHPAFLKHEEKLAKLYKEGAISEVQMNAIVSLAPHLINLAQGVSETAEKSQREGFFTHRTAVEFAFKAQESIAKNAKSDELLRHLSDNIQKMNSDNNDTQKKMSDDNNSTYVKIATGVGGAILGIGAIVGGIFWGKNKL
jgi:uncharacterized FlaG/YvyC family protein